MLLLLMMLLQRSVLHQMTLPVPPPATRTGAQAARRLGFQQCGASLMLLYASVEERGYLAHCGANMALASCHPRRIWCAAARWLQGSRDLQREVESERCMMHGHSHKHQWLPGRRPWPWLQHGGFAPERLVARQSSGLAASAASRAQVFCARMKMMLWESACSGLCWASESQASWRLEWK